MCYQELLENVEKYYKEHKTDFEYLSDDEKIKIEILFGKVYVSKGVVKAVWSLCYINILHYATFMNGVKPNTPTINPNFQIGGRKLRPPMQTRWGYAMLHSSLQNRG